MCRYVINKYLLCTHDTAAIEHCADLSAPALSAVEKAARWVFCCRKRPHRTSRVESNVNTLCPQCAARIPDEEEQEGVSAVEEEEIDNIRQPSGAGTTDSASSYSTPSPPSPPSRFFPSAPSPSAPSASAPSASAPSASAPSASH